MLNKFKHKKGKKNQINYFAVLNISVRAELDNQNTECPKFTANLFYICFRIDLRSTEEDAVQICGKFWDTQYSVA